MDALPVGRRMGCPGGHRYGAPGEGRRLTVTPDGRPAKVFPEENRGQRGGGRADPAGNRRIGWERRGAALRRGCLVRRTRSLGTCRTPDRVVRDVDGAICAELVFPFYEPGGVKVLALGS